MQKNLIQQIEKLKKRPITSQFYTDELHLILREYAPNYPQCTDNEMFSVWNALFFLGWLKGKSYEARRRRQKARRAAEKPQAIT